MRLLLAALFLASLSPMFADAWIGAPMLDVACATKGVGNPDAHTTKCALECQQSGFGILTPDGKFLKFDGAGNKKTINALKTTKKTDHLRVDVVGTPERNILRVETLKLN